MGLDAGLRPGLARLAREGGSPEQFQFGIRRIWLDCLETDTEAYGAVAVTGGVVAALSRTQVRPAVAPGTTPLDPIRARCRTLSIGLGTGKIVRLPVLDPFPDITVHVKKAPRIGRILTNIAGLLNSLRETVSNLRTELENIQNEQEVKVQTALSSSQIEINHLRSSLSSLREKLDREQSRTDQKIQKITATSLLEVKDFKKTIEDLRGELEKTELDKAELEGKISSRYAQEIKSLQLSLVQAREKCEQFMIEKEEIAQSVTARKIQSNVRLRPCS